MKCKIWIFAFISFLGFISCQNNKEMKSRINPPIAKKIPVVLEKHGIERIDNYFWLNERENPEVIKYLEEENAYTKAMLKHTEGLQDTLYNEIIGRIKQTDMSVPYKKDGFWYYTRFEDGKEYPVYGRKKESLENHEEILINVNELAESHSYYQVAGLKVSPNNKLLAFGEDTVSRRKYTIRFRNLETGDFLDEQIPNTTGNIIWANDNKTLFYTIKDSSLRAFKVLKHILGTNPENDQLVFHEKDETFDLWLYKSKSEKFIFFCSESTLSTECRFVDASKPENDFQIFLPREKNHEYVVLHYQNNFYIKTNWNAQNFKLMKCPIDNTLKENWTDVIPHRNDVLLESVEIFKDYLVVDERKNGLTQLRVINWNDQSEYYIDFGEPTYTAWISVNPEFESNKLRFGYSSLTTPSSTFDFNMETKEKELLKQQEVLGGFDANYYQAERIYVEARDGVKVPVSMVYRKGIKMDGKNPLLLYAYGSYGSSSEASFSSSRLSLLDRGFIYAIAHVRGGEELGRQWYEDGKMLQKMNTFYDFIDCAEYLETHHYTNPDLLCAYGGSAGGLLIGAVINLRPDLFKAVVAAVPFVDVITTMLDESIPLTTGEYDEWGNPNDKTYFDYMLSYSPYDNVEEKEYPAMLVTTGLHDSQVQYWEPAKWVAKLRDMKTDNNLLLLQTNMEAGHGGASGRFKAQKETALIYAFFLDQVKI